MFFSEYFEIDPRLLLEYGALDICFSFNFGPTWPEVNFVKSAYSVRHSLLNVVKYYNQLLFRLRGAT